MHAPETLRCPDCGNMQEFLVSRPEWMHYIYNALDNTWKPDGYDIDPIPDNYKVICSMCECEFEHPPWD